jgi:hypothetical protein
MNAANTSGQPEATSAEFRSTIAAREQLIRGEQIALLYRQTGVVLIATFILATLIVILLWPVVGHDHLLWWLGVYLLVTIGRYFLFNRYEADPERLANANFWGYSYVVGTGLAGLTWGVAAILFFVADEPVFMLALTCLYSVVVAVAAQPLGSFLHGSAHLRRRRLVPTDRTDGIPVPGRDYRIRL